MKMPELPRLPETHIMLLSDLQSGSEPGFNTYQLEAYALEYGRQVREACAKACESVADAMPDFSEGSAAYSCAASIRQEE